MQDGKKLVPSVNRVFSTSHEMYVFLEAYKPAPAATSQPLFAFVSLYRASVKAFETPPIAVVPNAASRLGKVPLSFSLGIDGLAPGEYDCQITVIDPSTLKQTFWRAPILLVQ